MAQQLEQIWQEIPHESLRVPYHYVPSRVAACIQARGRTPDGAPMSRMCLMKRQYRRRSPKTRLFPKLKQITLVVAVVAEMSRSQIPNQSRFEMSLKTRHVVGHIKSV
ncbi:hypothetical protein TNCV_4175701 [Trichonephila clavipes]|nr:hypothetical protein TNCV_4175701 [Trichonephila clavipes]